jgi:hypothetical protein
MTLVFGNHKKEAGLFFDLQALHTILYNLEVYLRTPQMQTAWRTLKGQWHKVSCLPLSLTEDFFYLTPKNIYSPCISPLSYEKRGCLRHSLMFYVKFPVRPTAPQITLTSTQNKQNIPNSKLVPGSSRLASSHVVGLRRSSCLLSEFLLLNLSLEGQASQFILQRSLLLTSASLFTCQCV